MWSIDPLIWGLKKNLRIKPFDFFNYSFHVFFVDVQKSLRATAKIVNITSVDVKP